jgi:hypothetical protein
MRVSERLGEFLIAEFRMLRASFPAGFSGFSIRTDPAWFCLGIDDGT